MKLNNEPSEEKQGSSYIGYLATMTLVESIDLGSLSEAQAEAIGEAINALYIISQKANDYERLVENKELTSIHLN